MGERREGRGGEKGGRKGGERGTCSKVLGGDRRPWMWLLNTETVIGLAALLVLWTSD